MSISYLTTIEQLSVLAHFCGLNSFPMLPKLPFIKKERCEAILKELWECGAVQINGGEVSPDISLMFVLSAIASPALVIQADSELYGYCTKNLLVAVSKAAHLSNKYKITPLQNADELALYLHTNKTDDSCCLIYLGNDTKNGITKSGNFSQAELRAVISQVYTEV